MSGLYDVVPQLERAVDKAARVHSFGSVASVTSGSSGGAGEVATSLLGDNCCIESPRGPDLCVHSGELSSSTGVSFAGVRGPSTSLRRSAARPSSMSVCGRSSEPQCGPNDAPSAAERSSSTVDRRRTTEQKKLSSILSPTNHQPFWRHKAIRTLGLFSIRKGLKSLEKSGTNSRVPMLTSSVARHRATIF